MTTFIIDGEGDLLNLDNVQWIDAKRNEDGNHECLFANGDTAAITNETYVFIKERCLLMQ